MWPWFLLAGGALVVWRVLTVTSSNSNARKLAALMRQAIATDPQTQGARWAIVVVDNFRDHSHWHPYVEVAYEYERGQDARAYFNDLELKNGSSAFLMDVENGTIEQTKGEGL